MALTAVPQQLSRSLADSEIQQLLGLRVAKEMLGATKDGYSVEIGPLSMNYFSYTFSVKANTTHGQRDVFVKIPKSDLRGAARTILPISPEDRQMAQEEVFSLKLLGEKWADDDQEVRWIALCGVVPEYNALVTDRVFADETLLVFRRFDLLRRFGSCRNAQRLRHSMARIGTALQRFHRTSTTTSVFRLSDEMPKFEFYCRELSTISGSAWPACIFRKLQSMGDMQFASVVVPTLKGIDIRNVLIDALDRIYLLDPGKTKFTHPEADLARFLMTYRILYWGSPLLLLLRKPDPKAEADFLAAYYANAQVSCPQLLSLFLLKEQLKHWHTALDSLQRRPWPPILKRLAAWVYVNPFYARQVARQYQSLTELV